MGRGHVRGEAILRKPANDLLVERMDDLQLIRDHEHSARRSGSGVEPLVRFEFYEGNLVPSWGAKTLAVDMSEGGSRMYIYEGRESLRAPEQYGAFVCRWTER